jgi:transcriptional regulator with XRE-family HTH domain
LSKNEDSELNLVKKTCKELGITQKELAEKTGFNPTVISRWNNGSNITLSAQNHLKLLIENHKLKNHLIKSITN